jgi:hypothetical protein
VAQRVVVLVVLVAAVAVLVALTVAAVEVAGVRAAAVLVAGLAVLAVELSKVTGMPTHLQTTEQFTGAHDGQCYTRRIRLR